MRSRPNGPAAELREFALMEVFTRGSELMGGFWDIEFLLHVSQLLFSCVRG